MAASTGLDATIVVVSHDSVIRVLLAYLMSSPLEDYRRWRVDPASLTSVELAGGQVALVRLNDVSHLGTTSHHHTSEAKESA